MTPPLERAFDAAEKAADLKLSPDIRTAVIHAIERHRRATDYRKSTGRKLVTKMRRHRRRAEELAEFLEELDCLPGHLAQEIAGRKDIGAACEIKRLRDLSAAFDEFLAESAEHNKGHRADRSVDVLLLDLQDIFIEVTGGASTAVSNRDGRRRGRFVDFVNALLRGIPREYRPRDVTSRWSTVRKLMRVSGRLGWHNWFGSAVPALLRPTRYDAYNHRA